MTSEIIANQHIDMVNRIIDMNNAIEEVWNYHPENPNRIDPVQYHAILLAKLEKLEQELKDFEAEIPNV